jgi:hypothetical protein
VDNLTATLEAGANVAAGDLWQGVYRFDSVRVTGRARLRVDDLDEFGELTIDPGSEVLLFNRSGPEVDVGVLAVAAEYGEFRLSGGVGAITDFSGIASARVVNRNTAAGWILDVQADGSFPAVVVDGAVDDELYIEATDAHPHPRASSTDIGKLPSNPDAPVVDTGLMELTVVGGVEYHLSGAAGSVGDLNPPIRLEIFNATDPGLGSWEAWSASDGSFDVVIGGSAGDEIEVLATDGHPDPLATTGAVGRLPYLAPLELTLQAPWTEIFESQGSLSVEATLSEVPFETVSVGLHTVAGSAAADADYQHLDETLTFVPGVASRTATISIFEDAVPEDDENFIVELRDPVGAELGSPSAVEITIFDNDGETVRVPYSVAVGITNHLVDPVVVDIIDGVATFADPLPEIVGRGDRVEIDGVGTVFIESCTDAWTCSVVSGRGHAPADVHATVAVIAPAFGSLADAVAGAGDSDHLRTFDLAAGNRALDLVCYGGLEDTTAVEIDGWVTSESQRIRMVAADTSYGHGPEWRHPGRWSGNAYRLEVWNQDCLRSTVGNISIEGLQFLCSGDAGVPVAAVHLDGVDGEVVISEALIHLSGAGATAERVAIRATSAAAAKVVVRNSVMWDLGEASNHAGILVVDSGVTLHALNNTIVGGGYGIHNLGGTVTATNNLVAATAIMAYEGFFEAGSSRNLAGDGSAPDPPPTAGGPVTVLNPAPSFDADFHLGCGVLDQSVAISHDFEIGSEEELRAVFDGDPETLLRSASINPAKVRLEFGEERAVTGTSVVLSHWSSHDWMVAAADSVEDLEAQAGSYRVFVPWRTAENEHLIWDGVAFDSPESFQVIELSVQRNGGDDYVHVNEWSLDGLSPACGQGLDLSAYGPHPFVSDVDSVARAGHWDIGADQSNELTVGFLHGPHDWWEEEFTARIQVVLSEPAPAEVRVRYRTEDLSAVEGDDYFPEEGELVFAPGEFSRIIRVGLQNDGSNGDDGDSFAVILSDAVGARLVNDWWEIVLREGAAPARVKLDEELILANEADGVVTVEIRLSEEQTSNVSGAWDMTDGTAHIGADYRGMPHVNGAPWATFDIPDPEDTGFFEIELINDDVAEGVEGFLIKGGWADGAEIGVPSVGYVRITDDDGGSP